MGQTATPTRHNRTITVDFNDETTYFALVAHPKAFVEFVLAFLLSIGSQLLHKASGNAGDLLTRHSHYARVRLGGLTIWRVQCTTCKAVFTVLPHVVLRHRSMRPEVARDALLATHGDLSLELCAVLYHISPMALYRLVCAFGHHSLVTVLTRYRLPLPVYFLADAEHSRCLTEPVYLPKLFAMKGFHHPKGSQQAFLTGLTHLYNLVPYQRRAKHADQCGVEVEGGRLPTNDWFLNLQILTSGGLQ